MQQIDDIRATQIAISEWLKPLVEDAGSQRKLADRSGVSKQTIGRAIDPDEDYTTVMSTVNILKIAAATGTKPPAGVGAPAIPPGFTEPESVPVSHNEIPAELKPEHADQHVFKLKTRAVEMPPHGYMPGDLVMIDRTATPQKGDVVCAQEIDLTSGRVETIWRVYDPPYLYPATACLSVNRKPLTVDGERTDIVGPIVKSLRRRRVAA